MTLYLSFNGLINTLNTAVVSLSLPSVTLTFTCLDIGVDTLGATPLNVEWFNTFIGIWLSLGTVTFLIPKLSVNVSVFLKVSPENTTWSL